MNFIDLIVIIIILVLCIRGYLKGFVNELFSLLIIIIGLTGAFLLYGTLAEVFQEFIENTDLSLILSFFAIFMFITIVLIIIRNVIIQFIDRLNLADLDYVLGVVVGCVKGLLICGVILIFLRNHPIFRIDEVIDRSFLYPFVEKIFIFLISLLPDTIVFYVHKILGIR